VTGGTHSAAAARLQTAVSTWLATLDDRLRAAATHPFDSRERFIWGFVPGDRTGVSIGELNDPQRAAALEIIRVAMSERGAAEVRGVVALEPILGELERSDGRGSWMRRESGRYWFGVYGDPSGEAPWAWRVEGHHVSVRSTVADGRVVSVTPSFLGANPATIPSGPRAGQRTLDGEETLARAALAAMSAEERAIAVVDPVAPPEIVSGTSRRARLDEVPMGLRRGELGDPGRVALDALIGHYLGRVPTEVAEAAWARISAAGLDELAFAWAGSDQPGRGHYYAIQSPGLLIEYDNTQNGANHIHSVWRDPSNDWGDDILAAHYQAAHHQAAHRP
jgi:hypothetical protein